MVEENGKREENGHAQNTAKIETAETSASVQLANILVLLERSVRAKDTKVIVGRLMRQTAAVRSRLEPEVLTTFIEEALPAEHSTKTYLASQISKVRRCTHLTELSFHAIDMPWMMSLL